jgi:hypothetical protein
MNTAGSTEPRIQDVRVTEDEIVARLVDGRIISVPLAWSWRLSEATPRQRARFRLIGSGQGVHWPDVDEDISVEGMLHGVPAHRSRAPQSRKAGGPVPRSHPTPRAAARNRRTGAFSRRAPRVAPRPGVGAHAADARRSPHAPSRPKTRNG